MKLKHYALQGLTYVAVVSFFLGATWWGSRAVTVISQRLPVERSHTVVIDAGHGGEDGGAVSLTGVKESGINLDIALKLRDLLHLLGCRTRMIRTTDVSVYTSGTNLAQKKVSDLKERVRMVAETENAVLVSVHQNTYSDPQYNGAQVFYGRGEGSGELAEGLQNTLAQTVNPGSRRRCKAADGVYLMEHVGCTAILVECGFLSHPAEEAKLRDGAYQCQLAAVIGTSLCNWLDGQTND